MKNASISVALFVGAFGALSAGAEAKSLKEAKEFLEIAFAGCTKHNETAMSEVHAQIKSSKSVTDTSTAISFSGDVMTTTETIAELALRPEMSYSRIELSNKVIMSAKLSSLSPVVEMENDLIRLTCSRPDCWTYFKQVSVLSSVIDGKWNPPHEKPNAPERKKSTVNFLSPCSAEQAARIKAALSDAIRFAGGKAPAY